MLLFQSSLRTYLMLNDDSIEDLDVCIQETSSWCSGRVSFLFRVCGHKRLEDKLVDFAYSFPVSSASEREEIVAHYLNQLGESEKEIVPECTCEKQKSEVDEHDDAEESEEDDDGESDCECNDEECDCETESDDE
jgi:hypothetical protein